MTTTGGGDAGRVRPTIADVARAAGVSRTTVSHALNGIGKVNPQTRERVRQVAEEIGYRPSPRATALRRGRSLVLGVASSMSSAVAGGPARLGFFMEVAAAAAERALSHGYALVLVPPPAPDERDATAADPLHGVAVDGLIVVEPSAHDAMVDLARSGGLPFVCVGRSDDLAPDELWVDLFPDEVADLLLRHLADVGSRHPVLMVGDRDRLSYRSAVERYQQLAAQNGWAEVVVRVSEAAGESGAREALGRLLDEHPETDAVFAFVDAFAAGVLAEAAERGLRVPEDLQVVTRYDGVRAKTGVPPITAVDLGLAAAAAEAVDRLVARLDGSDGAAVEAAGDDARRHPRLVARASSLRSER